MGYDNALKDYVEVNVRIERFWAKYPNGRIETEVTLLPSEPQEVLIKAIVFRDANDVVPASTGHAHEVKGSTYINKTSFIENGETSAIGRALAILGFEIKKSIASKEEVANAQLQQAQPAPKAEPKPQLLEHLSEYPSEAQLKLISTKLGQSGYLKKDMPLIAEVLSKFLGYEIKQLLEIKKSDVKKLVEFLTDHKKEGA